MTTIDYEQLAHQLITTKAASGSPSTIMAHGPGGLYSTLGLSKGIANAMILPSLGLMGMLPVRPSNTYSPIHGIFTGVTADTGNEPTDRCSNPPTAGASKLCQTTYVWGWVGRQSREVRLDKFGRRINRGEFMDQTLIGNPFNGPNVPEVPVPGGITPQMVTQEVGKIMFELAVSLLRECARDVYSGDPSNNTGTQNDGGRTYYRGLDLLISDGYQDVVTGVACPAADSIVEDYNNVNITTDPNKMIRTFASIWRRLNKIASYAGLDPVKWAISMRADLFYELTEIWPCSYLTNRCSDDALLGTQSRVTVSAEKQIAMRNEMRADYYGRKGQFLWIDGVKVPVILDDAIAETEPTTPGEYASDVYFIPLTVLGGSMNSAPLSEGGSLVTYMEYLSFDQPEGAMDAARALAPDQYQTTANGRYLWMRDTPQNLCVLIKGWHQPRLILETPHLAARLTNIAYTPIAHTREPFTDDSYFVNGGQTNFDGFGPSLYDPTG